MGHRISWLAVRGIPPGEVLSRLGLRGTMLREALPESPLVGVPLDSGWYLVRCDRSNHRFVRGPVLERLSADCAVLACDVDEGAHRTAASGWQLGRCEWWVIHDPEAGPEPLGFKGDPPAAFHAIYEELSAAQREDPEVDYLSDVPLEVAAAVCGFWHDRDVNGQDGDVFQVLAESCTLRKGFPGLQLTVEDEPLYEAPSAELLRAAVEWLTPRGGPSFLVLEGRGEDYAQAAGGDGVYTVEWREYDGPSFRHWVAGRTGPTDPLVRIPTNGSSVAVRHNEQLGAEDVTTILTAYAQGTGRPNEFTWRDVTGQFQ